MATLLTLIDWKKDMATSAVAKKLKVSIPKAPASHPPVIDMVKAAITAAKDRKRTSLATIKKFVAANYKVDVEKLGPHICRGIVHVVEKGVLVHVGNEDKGASGSFKIADKSAEHKPKVAKKPKVVIPKKSATPKKPKSAKKSKPKTPKR